MTAIKVKFLDGTDHGASIQDRDKLPEFLLLYHNRLEYPKVLKLNDRNSYVPYYHEVDVDLARDDEEGR